VQHFLHGLVSSKKIFIDKTLNVEAFCHHSSINKENIAFLPFALQWSFFQPPFAFWF